MTEKRKSDGMVYVGEKPVMSYVTAAVMQLQEHETIMVKARGKFIARAVDVSQMLTKRFIEHAKVTEVRIDSEEFTNAEGKDIRVSVIEIEIVKE